MNIIDDNDNNEKYYTASTLAAAAGLDPSRIRQILLSGEIPEARKSIFGYWLIPREAGDRWLRNRPQIEM